MSRKKPKWKSHPWCIDPCERDALCPDHGCGFQLTVGQFGPYWTCQIGDTGCEWTLGRSATDGKLRMSCQQIRTARKLTHAHFDKLWKQHGLPRGVCYALVRKAFGMTPVQCHIQHLNLEGLRAFYAETTRIMLRRGFLKPNESPDGHPDKRAT